MQISVVITGTKELRAKIKKIGPSLHLFQGAMNEIGKEGARYFANEGMASQGGVFGSVWPRLNPKYSVTKAKNYPGRPPMVKTGKLKSGFQYSANNTQVLIDNAVDYFKYHDSTAARKVMPYRQMTGVNSHVENMIKSIIEKDVRRKLDAVQL